MNWYSGPVFHGASYFLSSTTPYRRPLLPPFVVFQSMLTSKLVNSRSVTRSARLSLP